MAIMVKIAENATHYMLARKGHRACNDGTGVAGYRRVKDPKGEKEDVLVPVLCKCVRAVKKSAKPEEAVHGPK